MKPNPGRDTLKRVPHLDMMGNVYDECLRRWVAKALFGGRSANDTPGRGFEVSNGNVYLASPGVERHGL